jgi:transcription antitermination factor NusG
MEKWHVIQTRPRWEKKVVDALAQQGVEGYCPVRKVRRRWSDRIKTLEEPVFRSCVFVKILSEQKTMVRLTEGVVNFVYENGKPAFVKSSVIAHFRKYLLVSKRSCIGEEGKLKGSQLPDEYLDGFQSWLIRCMERPKLS